jgi:hypothetical protein
VLGSLLAVAVPAFVRNLHASHLVEATDGLARIERGAIAFSNAPGNGARALPPSAPLTPASVPRGERLEDPPGTWDAPAWRALGFRAAPEGMRHRYSFATDLDAAGSELVARAHGDLDGDGVLSRFEVRVRREGASVHAVPGMIVADELE